MPLTRPEGQAPAHPPDAPTVIGASPVPLSAARIVASDGPDKGLSAVLDGKRPGRVLVGTSDACDIRLSDPSVSRRHAAIELDGSALRVIDLGSTNGTRLNGVRIVEAFVGPGDVMTIGATQLRFERAQDAVAAPPAATGFGRLHGQSTAMQRLYPILDRLARSDVPVLVEGETGTGKEVLAEALHEASARASGPFVVFDCTAVAPSLLESALFGHERGAFTGAVARKRGVFEQAEGGTLLLDEIGDLDLALQSRLLRAIQRREIQRVGGEGWLKVDIRIVAATRRDLEREVAEKRFRDDLFFRLAVARVELPPLRRRASDVPLLAQHFHTLLGGKGPLPPEFFARLEQHPFPGNVRELENLVARRIALGDLETHEQREPAAPSSGSQLPGQLPGWGTALPASSAGDAERAAQEGVPLAVARERTVSAFERRYLEAILAVHGGNVTKAATAAGIARRYFHLLLARHR